MNEYNRLIAEDKVGLCVEVTAVRVAELIAKQMERLGLSQAQFARKMDVTPGRVCQILDADSNLQLRTIAKALAVLGLVLEVDAVPLESLVCPEQWEIATIEQVASSESALRVIANPHPSKHRDINGRNYSLAA